MNVPADPQISRRTKRYNDPQPSMKRTNVLRILLLLSSLVIGGVVVFLVVYFVTKKPSPVPPPAGQTIPDELYSGYLQEKKRIYAWSHTSQSKIGGAAAYSALLANKDNAFDYLLNFTNRHRIESIYLYGGCAQWDADTWAQGSLPFAASLENAIRKAKLKGYDVNLVAYLNDDINNMTNYEAVKNFSNAVVTLNKRLGTQGIDSVSLKISPDTPEAYAYALEAYTMASSILGAAKITLEGTVFPDEALAPWSFRPELYVSLDVTKVILELLNREGRLSYGLVLSTIVDIANVVTRTTSEYTLIEQWEGLLKTFKELRPQFDVSQAGLASEIYASPGSFLRALPQLYTLCKTYASADHVCGAPSVSSYLDYHSSLYILEPIESDVRYLVDLYYNNGR